MAGVPSDYEDDAERIDREYIPDDATTEAEVEAALRDAGFPDAAIETGDAQTGIGDWMVDEGDAWESVGPQTQDAGSVRRELDAASNGTVSDSRADAIADSVGSEIQSARAEAAQRVTDDGQVRTEDGRFVGSLQNVSEEVRDDGIYYVNQNTGTEGRAARFDR
jgi:hypothetical protein